MVKILVVEDNDVVRETLAELINMEDNLMIVGTAENGKAAYKLLQGGLSADVVITDLNMPEMDGIELTEIITASYKQIKVIVLTMHDRKTFVDKAFEAGAKGFLLKNGNMEELYSAISTVELGNTVIGADVSSKE